MTNYEQVRDDLKALDPTVRQLVLVDLLMDGSLDFTEISKAYVAVLEQQSTDHWRQIHQLATRLSAAWDYIPDKKHFTKAAAAFALLKSKVFRTAGVEKDYEAYLELNPFDEDDSGFPRTQLKDEGHHPRNRKPTTQNKTLNKESS